MRKEIEQVRDLIDSSLSSVAKAQVILNTYEKADPEPNSGPIILGINELISRLQMELGLARTGLTSARDLSYSISCHNTR